MNIDITQIAVALIGLLGIIITGVVVPYFKSKTTAEQWQNIQSWVYTAVNAMETIYDGAGRGEEKKQAVREFVEKMCKENGIKLDLNAVDLAIQDAWDTLGLNKEKLAV